MAQKLARYGGAADVKRVENGMPKRDGAKGYATGGIVSDDEGDEIEGMPAKPRLDRSAKKKSSDKVNVNVIVMPKGGKSDETPKPPMAGMPMPPPAAPMPAPPMAGPPVPPMGPDAMQGAPLMRAKGGRVMKHDDTAMDKKMIKSAVGKHEANMHKGEPKTKLAKGGRATIKGMDAGAGGALGRMEKAKAYGSKPKK